MKYWEEQKQIGIAALEADTKAEEEKPLKGRPKAIESPAMLWELACDYFQSVDDKPLQKQDFLRGGMEAGKKIDVSLQRPYTWQGFDNFLFSQGIVTRTAEYKYDRRKSYENFAEVIAHIDSIMYANKFEGAAAGIFNSSIIARDLGLVDKTETKVQMEQPLFPEED